MKARADNEAFWREHLTGEGSAMPTQRRRNRRLPGNPRCKTCLFPLAGPLTPLFRLVTRRTRSAMNPNFCNLCEDFVRTHPGGAEIELSLLFADVRGSTSLAEAMTPADFGRLMNRFYADANRVLIDSDALVDKLVGDEVIGLYLPVIGPEHAAKAIVAARDLLRETSLPVGAGVHTGTAYVGAVGSDATVVDFTALGDAVNVAARLSGLAAVGEVLLSEDSYAASGLDLGDLEQRRLELKGRSAPIDVRVLRIEP